MHGYKEILLSKLEGLLRVFHPAHSLHIPDGIIKTTLMLFGKIHITISQSVTSLKKGGLSGYKTSSIGVIIFVV